MDSLVTFTAVAALGAVIYTAVNLVRYLRAGDWNGVLTLVLACAAGIGVVWLAAQADVTDDLVMIEGGPALGALDGWSVVIAGIALASLSAAFADLRKAIDNTASAEKPLLVPGSTTPPDS